MIQFAINKAYFLQALHTTRRAISSKNAIPILSTIKIEVTSDGIYLTGSNGQISIENSISASEENAGLLITQPGSILLEANFFINVVSSLPDVTLTFEEIEQYQVLLKSAKSEITLKGKDAEQYPRIQEVDSLTPLIMDTKMLKSIIAETSFAASTQESRPILTADNFDVVIPSRSLKELSAVFSDGIENLEIFFSANQILFRSETISFYTRLLEGIYPDTNRLLSDSFETEVVFETSTLRSAMERSYLISNASQSGTVKLEIINGNVSAHVNSPEVGKVNEDIDVLDVSGSDLIISFNPTYLIDALKALKSESVRIRFISPVRPFTLTPADDSENFIQLITPVRTN